MKKALTAIATFSLLLAPAALAESKSFSASDFSRIEVEGAMNVVYKTAPQTSVRVETSGGDFSDARIENDGDTLLVSRVSAGKKGGFFSWGGRSLSVSDDGKTVKVNGKKKPVYTVYVTGPDLEGVKASGSSRFESSTIEAAKFEASASSSATVTLGGTATSASLSASSSGEVEAAGFAVGTLNVSASSSGDADVLVTGTGKTSISASSSGDVILNSAGAASFDVSASSGAEVELSGSCNAMTVSASSGADVEADELRCAGVTVSASSGADVDAFASGAATARASSGADVTVAGKPATQEATKSSGGSVSFTG